MARSLQEELKRKQAFDSLEQEVVLSILRTSDVLENRIGRLLKTFGLTSSQYNILRILRGEGEELPSLEIANRMIQVVPAITGLIDRLEKQGWVKRKRCNSDRRVVFVGITKPGLELLSAIDAPITQLQGELLSGLAEPELKRLLSLLAKVRERLEQISDS